MHRNHFFASLLFVGASLVGCASSPAPSGFSKGDHWSMPLVGALENGQLLVPVSVGGKGPYLFYLDPDAPTSAVDQQVIDEANLPLGKGPTIVDENGDENSRGFTSLQGLKLGDLAVEERTVIAVPKDFFNLEGRRVHGMIGRDVIADRLVFGFDRDQSIVTLSVPAVFTPPAGAANLTYVKTDIDSGTTGGGMVDKAPQMANQGETMQAGKIDHASGPSADTKPVARRVVNAKVGNADVRLHLDLGAANSELRQELWSKAGLTAAPVEGGIRLVDEAGTVRTVDSAAPAEVTAGAVKGHASFVPYVEKRFGPKKLDGSLGLDFFRNYAVYASWNAATYFVKPRGAAAETVKARLGRWGAELASCAHPGCAEVKIAQSEGVIKLEVTRDPQAAGKALELFIGATPAAGKTAGSLLVELPAGTDTVSGGLPAEYEGATLAVLDASTFLRPCQGNGGCVYPAPSH